MWTIRFLDIWRLEILPDCFASDENPRHGLERGETVGTGRLESVIAELEEKDVQQNLAV